MAVESASERETLSLEFSKASFQRLEGRMGLNPMQIHVTKPFQSGPGAEEGAAWARAPNSFSAKSFY
ncbi:unnamed protein product [Cuscuta campestris]|uniref:Uncharacterized protein n=1 Tax=Cuscuta campestris TaxID=132261 RepID=A0A484MDS8_9ASTE|nr:unnamed protein product [Cuscuta campestris]